MKYNLDKRTFIKFFGITFFSFFLIPFKFAKAVTKKVINENLTKKQREIIAKRIELSGFVASSLAETALNEINQLKSLMDAESNLLSAYFGLLHQNQLLLKKILMFF